jgi:hypothetical protein
MPRKTLWAVVLWFCFLPPNLFAISAQRAPGESFESARDRNLRPIRSYAVPTKPTAYEAAVPLADLDLSSLPTQLRGQELFELIRDSRYLASPMQPGFARRSSWLFPQDGCWVRASVSRRLAKKKGYGELKKLFIFGALHVTTKNAPSGRVGWWYHVVPVYSDEFGTVRVIDPAIDTSGPLVLEDWARTMVASPDEAKYSICSSSTYDPSSACDEIDPNADKNASVDQVDYLNLEWSNLLKLGRIPRDELADFPPWSPRPVTP